MSGPGTARLRENPGRAWSPADLVDHAAAYGTPRFPPGQGFEYCDTGYVVAGILVEQATGQPLHEVHRELIFDPAVMDTTWLEGYEPVRQPEAAHHYTGELDWTTVSPTIDWAGGGLVTTAPDLVRSLMKVADGEPWPGHSQATRPGVPPSAKALPGSCTQPTRERGIPR